MDIHVLPVDVLRLVLQALLGEERQDGYRLLRDLQRFALVCKSWRDAVFSTPLRLNLDYMPELSWGAVRWLLKATFADLQVHPNFHVNRLLTSPDFVARNRWTLQRLWGAQMVGVPGRWPQFRHFQRLETLELNCDSQLLAVGEPQFFESRLLAPLTHLKHLSLQQFGGADLSRLPPTLRTLQADLDAALPLVLPPGVQLEELSITTERLLVDWAQLCSQVDRLIAIEAAFIDMLATPNPDGTMPSLLHNAARGFKHGCALEMEVVAQEVTLVRLAGMESGGLPRHIPQEAYQPEVLEAVHLVSLAADFQAHEYRSFGCTYNPDDLQTDEDLGMTDGITVRLYRHLPNKPQVLGFTYGLGDEQTSYLLSEAQVEGLSLEAMEAPDPTRLISSEEFRRLSGGSLRWLQGVDLLGELELGAFSQLQRLEGYLLPDSSDSAEAVGRLPAGLTLLDLCGVPKEDADPSHRDSWPNFVSRQQGRGHPSIAHLTQLKELSLRHFRNVDLSQHVPHSLEVITLECLRPLNQVGGNASICSCPACAAAAVNESRSVELSQRDGLHFLLPPLPPGAQRTLHIQLHQNEDYMLRRPVVWLHQFLHHATHVTISVTSDPVTQASFENEDEEDSDEEEEQDEQGLAEEGGGGGQPAAVGGMGGGGQGPQQGAAAHGGGTVAGGLVVAPILTLATSHSTLREALEWLSASKLESLDVDAPEVLLTSESGTGYISSRGMQQYIRQHFGHTWLIWMHESNSTEEDEGYDDELGATIHTPALGGGFTLKRK